MTTSPTTARSIDALQGPRVLLPDVTGDLLVLDLADVEVGDLVFYSGHLVRRVLTRPRDDKRGDAYVYEVEAPDGRGARGSFQSQVGQSRLLLRPTVVSS